MIFDGMGQDGQMKGVLRQEGNGREPDCSSGDQEGQMAI